MPENECDFVGNASDMAVISRSWIVGLRVLTLSRAPHQPLPCRTR